MDDERRGPAPVEGRPTSAAANTTLLHGLVNGRFPVLQRSIRYHRPRAPFCGVGYCTNCLVRVNGVPNVRACQYVPRPGDRVRTENAWPSTRLDLLGSLDLIFRHGLDTLHGFRRPAFATPLFHRVVRRLAGYGRLPDAASAPARIPGELWETETLVVGAGRSGTSTSRRLIEADGKVTVVERDRDRAPVEGARYVPGGTAVFVPPPAKDPRHPFRVVVSRGTEGALLVAAKNIVVATGGYDAGLWFGGSDRPGVMTAEAAVRFSSGPKGPPFRRALVFGGGARVTELLDRFGDRVEAIAGPTAIESEVVRRASALEVPLYPRTFLLSARGRSGVREVELAARGGGAPFRVAVDAVVLAHRRLPHPQLFFQAGARMLWRAGSGAYFPEVDNAGGTSVAGLFAVGEAAGVAEPADSARSGERAADAILGRPADVTDIPRIDPARPAEIEGYYRELLARPRMGGKWVACACEDVLLEELEDAARRGYRGIEVIKRYTSLGTGLCQGRYCLPDTLLLLARLEGRPAPEVGYITQRPPVVPTALNSLAGLPLDGVTESP